MSVVARLLNPQRAVFILLVLLLVAIGYFNPNFTDPGQWMRYAQRVAPVAIAAIGQYFVIVSGEFDLSLGALVTAQVIIAGNLIGQNEAMIWPVLGLMVGFGLLVGLTNGLITTRLKVPSFITTLGMMLALSGAIFYWTGGAATGNPVERFRAIGRSGIRDVPVVDIIPWSVLLLTAVLLGAIWFSRRPFGRVVVAVGDNVTAAEYAGANVAWVKTVTFAIASLCATLTGIILVGYAGVHPSVGRGYEFLSITAVVLGGTVLGGGRGWVVAAAAGAFTLEALFTLLTIAGVPSTFRSGIQGFIIILAVAYSATTFQARTRQRAIESSPDTGKDPTGDLRSAGSERAFVPGGAVDDNEEELG